MKTLVMAVQKGGVGKTSILAHVALDFEERGLRVAVVDFDTQAHTSGIMEKHGAACAMESVELFTGLVREGGIVGGAGRIVLFQATDALADIERAMTWQDAANCLQANLSALAGGFDVCLIDTGPTQGAVITAALVAADYVASPVKLDALGLQGVVKTFEALGNVMEYNPALRFLGMLPSLVDFRNPTHVRDLAALRESYPGETMPVYVGLRNSVAEAVGAGVPVWKLPKTSARKAGRELRAIAQHIYNAMEISA